MLCNENVTKLGAISDIRPCRFNSALLPGLTAFYFDEERALERGSAHFSSRRLSEVIKAQPFSRNCFVRLVVCDS